MTTQHSATQDNLTFGEFFGELVRDATRPARALSSREETTATGSGGSSNSELLPSMTPSKIDDAPHRYTTDSRVRRLPVDEYVFIIRTTIRPSYKPPQTWMLTSRKYRVHVIASADTARDGCTTRGSSEDTTVPGVDAATDEEHVDPAVPSTAQRPWAWASSFDIVEHPQMDFESWDDFFPNSVMSSCSHSTGWDYRVTQHTQWRLLQAHLFVIVYTIVMD